MNDKISWYREVLEMEPNSRVFFPMAQLMAESGQHGEASVALRAGLEHHPDHFEAKLLLLECLAHQGQDDEVRSMVEAIADTLGGFPVFWQTWASLLSSRSDAVDTAMAMNFLAAHFQGLPISWGDVIAEGLKGFLASRGIDIVLPTPAPASAPAPVAPPEEEFVFEAEEPPAKMPAAAVLDNDFPLPPTADDADDDDSGEPFSLRTKTMAVLLAEQGDFKGALEIYKELLGTASTDEKRAEIQQRIEDIKARQAAAADAPDGSEGADAKSLGLAGALDGKNKLMHTLEALAQRLEERASG